MSCPILQSLLFSYAGLKTLKKKTMKIYWQKEINVYIRITQADFTETMKLCQDWDSWATAYTRRHNQIKFSALEKYPLIL